MTAETLDQQRLSFGEWLGIAPEMGVKELRDADARIVDEGARQGVVLFFSHADFPGTRFGYRAKPPGEDRYEEVWLAEELATGALQRLLRDTSPTRDAEGTIWLELCDQVLRLGA